mgnify:CR=1 FL=1|tara:strand:+ start:241 stop:555 length:315 start_codon:yes stop_codon:yes gene_type:complete
MNNYHYIGNMETLVDKYMNDELVRDEITKELIKTVYLTKYPKPDLYTYPMFCVKKLTKYNYKDNDAVSQIENFLNENEVIDDNAMESFFNLDCITPEFIGLMGW